MHYHIIGIAGSGMSAIAAILLDQGHSVSGSDPSANRLTAALAARGATIYQGHAPAHVAGADAVLATAAVRSDHLELVAARAAGIPVLGRADLWREWSQQRPVVAVAGAHGKTTTSAMIAVALRGAGIEAGYLIGAEAPDLGGNAAWGRPDTPLVIEADEYDRVFLALRPAVAVITNVEWDHPDIYPSAEEYAAAFARFAALAPAPDRVVLCGDDPGALALGLTGATLYGIEEALATDPVACRLAPFDWSASGVAPTADGGVRFDLWRYNRQRFARRRPGSLSLRLPGRHNVRNALAALAVCALLQAPLDAAARALAAFRGTARRFEIKGEAAGVTVVDDYAHHPTEARATLEAARLRFPGRRLVLYLQPHTFSRTAALLDAWPAACAAADLVRVGDVYAAREQGDAPALARALAERVAALGLDARYAGGVEAAARLLAAEVRPGDVVLTLGAGDGDRVGVLLLEHVRAG
jgi:UDP-N-acetylmuramate--alanine ligase